jgi:hypothetical protein
MEATAEQIQALLRLAEPPGSDAVPRGIPRLLLERVRALRERGRRPAIVAIDRGACSGCHLRLPTMMEHQARHSLALYTCPHCRRLLYSRELLRDDTASATPSRRQAPGSVQGRS